MAYDIRLVKIVSGDTVLGKFNAEKNVLEAPAILQTIPTQQGVQMALLPFGYPFEEGFLGELNYTHVIYEFNKCPEDLETKYLEATSNITIASGASLSGLGNLSELLK